MIDPHIEESPEGRTLVIPWNSLMGRTAPVCLGMLTPMVAITGFAAYEGWGFKALFLGFAGCWAALAYMTAMSRNSTRMSLRSDGAGLEVSHGPFPTLQPSGRVPCSLSTRVFLRPREGGVLSGFWALAGNDALQDLCVGENEESGKPVFSGLSRAEGAALAHHLKLFLSPQT